jgi:hypothetical protein
MASGGVRRLLFTCGMGESGQLGHGSNAGTTLFTAVRGLMGSDTRAAACGSAHTAAVSANGTLATFGSNSHHQLGHSQGVAMVSVPQVVSLPDACQAVACGAAFTLALTKFGDLWGVLRPEQIAASSAHGSCQLFDSNSHRQLDHSETAMVSEPHDVSLPDACQAVACGAAFMLALTKSGDLWGALCRANSMGRAITVHCLCGCCSKSGHCVTHKRHPRTLPHARACLWSGAKSMSFLLCEALPAAVPISLNLHSKFECEWSFHRPHTGTHFSCTLVLCKFVQNSLKQL